MTTLTLTGSSGNDFLDAAPYAVQPVKFFGYGGNDVLLGGAEDDIIIAGTGNDSLEGGAGNDLLRPGEGSDAVDGGLGLDIVSYVLLGSGPITADLGAGFVTLSGTPDTDTLTDIEGVIGTAFNDTLNGSASGDTLSGLDGDDIINGLGGGDRIRGGLGNDTIDAGAGNDVVIADFGSTSSYDGGDDLDLISFETAGSGITLDAGTFNQNGTVSDGSTFSNFEVFAGSNFGDSMTGSAFNDVIRGLDGDDRIRARQGDDTITGGEGNDVILAGFGDDVAFGGAGNDRIQGSVGNDEMYGMSGDDLLFSSHGSNTINGGSGIDTVSFIDRSDNIIVNLGSFAAGGGSFDRATGENDTIIFVENVIGTNGSDNITGDERDNVLSGRNGNDLLFGGAGNDIIEGEIGNDRIYSTGGDDLVFGGVGNDLVYLNATSDFVDGGADYDIVQLVAPDFVPLNSTGFTVTQSATIGNWTITDNATGLSSFAVNVEYLEFRDGYYLAGDSTFYATL